MRSNFVPIILNYSSVNNYRAATTYFPTSVEFDKIPRGGGNNLHHTRELKNSKKGVEDYTLEFHPRSLG